MRQILRRIVPVLLVLTLLLTLCGCDSREAIEENPAIRQGVDTVLKSLMAEDADSCYGAFNSEVSREAFDSAFAPMCDVLQGIESYVLTRSGYNYYNRNGVVTIQHSYWMISGEREFLVDAAIVEGAPGLKSFYITPKEQTTAYYTGTPGHMKDAGILQWVVLSLGVASAIFILWMMVDCLRRKPRRMAVWLVAILLGAVVFRLSYSAGSINFRLNFGINLSLSSLIRYGNGSFALNLLIPVGAIVYLIKRKQLPPRKAEVMPEEQETEETQNG